MAQIKITITIEADLMRDAHAAVDAMDNQLRKHDGRVVSAKLTQGPRDRIAAKQEWTATDAPTWREWSAKWNREHVGVTQLVEARTRDEVEAVLRDRLRTSGETFPTALVIEVRS